mmetsp:Transcript_173794/g.551831  ORF Transcript_173794/g.551831 Transcript_173794/m.551831 type:complete len:322 (+) Transcript_173794:490-1455(+)
MTTISEWQYARAPPAPEQCSSAWARNIHFRPSWRSGGATPRCTMKVWRPRGPSSSNLLLTAPEPANTWTPLPFTPKLCFTNQMSCSLSPHNSEAMKSCASHVGGKTPANPAADKCAANSDLSSSRWVNSCGKGRTKGRAASAPPDARKSPALRVGQQNAGTMESSLSSTRRQPYDSNTCTACLCNLPSGFPQPQAWCLPPQYTLPKGLPQGLASVSMTIAATGCRRNRSGTRRVQASTVRNTPSNSSTIELPNSKQLANAAPVARPWLAHRSRNTPSSLARPSNSACGRAMRRRISSPTTSGLNGFAASQKKSESLANHCT